MLLSMQGNLDLRSCLDRLDPAALPDDAQVELVLRKRLTKGCMQMRMLLEDEAIENEDMVMFSIASTVSRYNKPRLSVSVGRGLYSKAVEESFPGRRVGDTYELFVDGVTARITILDAKRKSEPPLTDEMVSAMDVDGVTTVSQYREYLRDWLILDASIALGAEVTAALAQQVQVEEPGEELMRRTAQCDYQYISTFHRAEIAEELGVSPEQVTPEQLRERKNYGNFEEFFENQRYWFGLKAKECVLLSAALGVELTGRYDIFTEYEALDRLQELLRKTIIDDLTRRK